MEINNLINQDCAAVGQLLQVKQHTKANIRVDEICKSELNVIRATQAACIRTPSNDGPSPVSSKICDILPDSTQAHLLPCDDLAAYLVFVRTDKTRYAKNNCFSKVSALRSARAACAAEFIPEGEPCSGAVKTSFFLKDNVYGRACGSHPAYRILRALCQANLWISLLI